VKQKKLTALLSIKTPPLPNKNLKKARFSTLWEASGGVKVQFLLHA